MVVENTYTWRYGTTSKGHSSAIFRVIWCILHNSTDLSVSAFQNWNFVHFSWFKKPIRSKTLYTRLGMQKCSEDRNDTAISARTKKAPGVCVFEDSSESSPSRKKTQGIFAGPAILAKRTLSVSRLFMKLFSVLWNFVEKDFPKCQESATRMSIFSRCPPLTAHSHQCNKKINEKNAFSEVRNMMKYVVLSMEAGFNR